MIIRGAPYSTGVPSSTRMRLTVPDLRGGDVVHRLHRLDDQQRVWPSDLLADGDEGRAPGSADR
jgi:hypothetical protein